VIHLISLFQNIGYVFYKLIEIDHIFSFHFSNIFISYVIKKTRFSFITGRSRGFIVLRRTWRSLENGTTLYTITITTNISISFAEPCIDGLLLQKWRGFCEMTKLLLIISKDINENILPILLLIS